MLRTFFINDGVYQNPYAISSVHVFNRAQNLSPETVLDDNGLVAYGQTSAAAMVFKPGGTGIIGEDATMLESYWHGDVIEENGNPDICLNASGIYNLGARDGEFACVLNGRSLGLLSGIDQNGEWIQSTASGAIRYIDVWTIKLTSTSAWKTYVNDFELFDNTFMSVTQPLLLRTKNTLYNKQVILGSKVDLKIGTEVTVENRDLDDSIKNIFKSSIISNPSITIKKHNEDSNLPSLVWVNKPGPSQDIRITSDNTLIYSFDTVTDLMNVDNLGSRSGTYSLQVEYNVLSEKIVSPQMYFIVK